jgi:phage terminase large subunit GpA-like protein
MRLPEDVLLVTVGVDVQARYVAILTMGWTPTAEAWALEWEQFDGDPRDPATLRSVVETAHGLHYAHPTGEIPVHLVGIDSQFLTDYVDARSPMATDCAGIAGSSRRLASAAAAIPATRC